MVRKTLIAASAFTLGLVGMAAPALADTKLPNSDYRVKYDAKRDVYCLSDRKALPPTGSHIQPVECKSRVEWASLGLDIKHGK